RIPGYRVYWPLRYDGTRRLPLPRARWRASASVNGADAGLVLDGDPWTYWSAPSPVSRPMLTVDLGVEEEIAGVYLALGERAKDAFHRVRVEVSSDGSAWQLVKEAQWDSPVTFRSNGQVSIFPDNVQIILFTPHRARWV